jgi:hypothetical protein
MQPTDNVDCMRDVKNAHRILFEKREEDTLLRKPKHMLEILRWI